MSGAFPAGGNVIVLGVGIIGVSSAVELLRAGYQVTVISPEDPGDTTAANNAGLLCYSHIDPMFDASTLSNLPLLLMRSSGPLFVTKSSVKSDASWFKAAVLACRPASVERTMVAMAALNRIGWEATEKLCGEAGISDRIHRSGLLYGYTSKAASAKAIEAWNRKGEYRVEHSRVNPKDLPEMASGFRGNLDCAYYAPGDGYSMDPSQVVRGLTAHAAAGGAALQRGRALEVKKAADGSVEVVLEGGDVRQCDGCVVAAGAWSGELAARLGDPVLLTSQRGYNHTYPKAGVTSEYPVIVEDLGLAVTPMTGGLRVGGWIEFDDKSNPPSEKIHSRLEKAAKDLMPGLKTDGAVKWMGNRPSTPDSLPVIGPSAKAPNVIYAFGHGHLGLTQAAVTARCVAGLASGTNPPVPLAPFGIERFA